MLENGLQKVDSFLSIVIKGVKLTVMVGGIYFLISSGSSLIGMFTKEKEIRLPNYTLSDISIVVDDNYHKHSKSFFQKAKEYILDTPKQHIKVEYGSKMNIIVDGAVNKYERNSLIKRELCGIYTHKVAEEVDLNKKRVFEVLVDLYCV